MKDLTKHMAKPMLPFQGRSLIEYQLQFLYQNNIKKIVINTFYLADQLEDFIEMRDKANPTGCVSMYAGNSSNDSDFEEIQIESYQTDDASASNVLIREEMFKKLLSRNYTPFERQIVHMHYYENMTIKEIAQKTGYCESRISQLHAKIIDRLQRKIKMNPQYMAHLTSMLNA
jgi:DNA-directed RNA polymerase specialized sigma subunit